MAKITKTNVELFFQKNKISSFKDLAKELEITERWARNKLKNKVISSITPSGKFITLLNDKEFDKYGLIKIDGVLFSKHNMIKNTILSIIKENHGISSSELKSILNLNISPHISALCRENKIFMKREGRHFLFSTQPFEDKVTIKEEFDLTTFKKDDKVLKHLQILKEIRGSKKIDVARKRNTSVETIRNIEARFKKDGTKGLIHTRESKTVKVSSAKQAAIITEVAKHPKKTAKEIKKSLTELGSIPLKTIKATIKEVKSHLEAKKKLLLEIQ